MVGSFLEFIVVIWLYEFSLHICNETEIHISVILDLFNNQELYLHFIHSICVCVLCSPDVICVATAGHYLPKLTCFPLYLRMPFKNMASFPTKSSYKY